jgi:hypothetical protein
MNLKYEEETDEILHLEHSCVWRQNLDTIRYALKLFKHGAGEGRISTCG